MTTTVSPTPKYSKSETAVRAAKTGGVVGTEAGLAAALAGALVTWKPGLAAYYPYIVGGLAAGIGSLYKSFRNWQKNKDLGTGK